MRLILALPAIAVAFASTPTQAVECSGMGIRHHADAQEVKKIEEGPTTYLVRSTGMNVRLKPDVATAWQECSGLWTAQQNGSGSGFGSCYAIDDAGDSWGVTWEVKDGERTWETVFGTGKHAKNIGDKGTFVSNVETFSDGFRMNQWSGECAD
ncbi:MAG: hypothetical protein AAF557_02465 [Pseudomonadota bacterium]